LVIGIVRGVGLAAAKNSGYVERTNPLQCLINHVQRYLCKVFGFHFLSCTFDFAAAAAGNPDADAGKVGNRKIGKASVAMESIYKKRTACRQQKENISFLIDLACFNLTLGCHFLFCMRVLHVSFFSFL